MLRMHLSSNQKQTRSKVWSTTGKSEYYTQKGYRIRCDSTKSKNLWDRSSQCETKKRSRDLDVNIFTKGRCTMQRSWGGFNGWRVFDSNIGVYRPIRRILDQARRACNESCPTVLEIAGDFPTQRELWGFNHCSEKHLWINETSYFHKWGEPYEN